MSAEIDTATSESSQLTKGEPSGETATSLRRLDRLATLMDDQFEVPLTKWRVGVDPVIGLLPGGGDWVAWVAAAYIIWGGARLGAPPRLLGTMALNVAIDLLGGYLPVLGDLFDAVYKSNRRNVDLLFDHFDFDGRSEADGDLPQRSTDSGSSLGRHLLAAALILLLACLAAFPIVVLWWLLQ